MNQSVEIDTISVTKSKDAAAFIKYNIESAIDEIETNDAEVKLKYNFTFLSNPIGSKINIGGVVKVNGTEQEIAKQLSPDEKNIPHIVNFIYQEIFPLIYMTTKSVQMPCPAYRLSQISKQAESDQITSDLTVEKTPSDSTVEKTPSDSTVEKTPSDSTVEKTPSDSTVEKTPSDSTVEKTPSDSTVEKTPADDIPNPVDSPNATESANDTTHELKKGTEEAKK